MATLLAIGTSQLAKWAAEVFIQQTHSAQIFADIKGERHHVEPYHKILKEHPDREAQILAKRFKELSS